MLWQTVPKARSRIEIILTYLYRWIHLRCIQVDRHKWNCRHCWCRWHHRCNRHCLLHIRWHLTMQLLHCDIPGYYIPTVWNFLLKSKLWNKLLIQWQLDIVPQHTKTSFSDTAQWFLTICRFHTVTNWNRRTVHLSRTCSGKIFRYTIKKEHAFKKQYPWFINTICLEGT